MCNQLLIDSSEGKVPHGKLFSDLASGKFKLAGQLMASSITMNGPAPAYFSPWVYGFFVGGLDSALEESPASLCGTKSLSKCYNLVCVFCMCIRIRAISIRNKRHFYHFLLYFCYKL